MSNSCACQANKRPADGPAEGDGATVIAQLESDPKTLDEAKLKLKDYKLVVCGEGLQALITQQDLFLVSEKDTIASPSDPLNQLGTGSWLDGKALTEAKAKAAEGPPS